MSASPAFASMQNVMGTETHIIWDTMNVHLWKSQSWCSQTGRKAGAPQHQVVASPTFT